MRHLIAFDLDGTLIDSRCDLAESANEMLALYGAAPLDVEAVTALVGEGARMLVARALVAAGVRPDVGEALDRFLDIYARRLTTHTRFYPGVLDAIRATMGRAYLAILTNKPERHTRLILDHFEVTDWFDQVIGGDSGFPRKPDPAGLRRLVELAGVTPGRTLYVGDSRVDVETAQAAGTRLCVAGYGFTGLGTSTPAEPDWVLVSDPAELGARLARFLAE